jgi:hypothetical protein
VLLVATVGLTVGFVVLFAGLAGAYHVEVLVRTTRTDETLPSFTEATRNR